MYIIFCKKNQVFDVNCLKFWVKNDNFSAKKMAKGGNALIKENFAKKGKIGMKKLKVCKIMA